MTDATAVRLLAALEVMLDDLEQRRERFPLLPLQLGAVTLQNIREAVQHAAERLCPAIYQTREEVVTLDLPALTATRRAGRRG